MEIGSDLAIKAGAVCRRPHSVHELLGHNPAMDMRSNAHEITSSNTLAPIGRGQGEGRKTGKLLREHC